MRIYIIVFFITLFSLDLTAEKTRNVSATITFHPPENLTIEDAKRTAVERARIQAIADEFGTTVSQANFTNIVNDNGNSDIKFQSIGFSEVKGEWIADTKEPEFSISYEGSMLVVTVTVWGKIREKKKAEVDLSVKTLRNGNESETFKDSDRFSVEFQSPINGYLSIWLIDDKEQQSYCLVPYENENGVAREIKSRKPYILLSTKDTMYPYQEETILTASSDRETNRLIIIFSSNKFSIPLTESGEFVPELTASKFEKWLQKNRNKDENMIVTERILEITK